MAALSAPSLADDETLLAEAANAALGTVLEVADPQTIAQSRAVLIAPNVDNAAVDRALLCARLGTDAWSNPLLLTVQSAQTADAADLLGDEMLVILAMTETGVAALTDDDPALGSGYDLAVVNISGVTIPRLSGFDIIAFTDGPAGAEAVRQGDMLFVIDAMGNAGLYGDYFAVGDILGLPNQFALFADIVESLRSSR
ncbi:MAG: hypothetical protein AAFX92_09960 [Pseudomonadota bacterium]